MAERRMFAKTIIDSDAFLDMPTSARLLYYDLSMRADDDGFVNSPKKIIRMTGASDDDLKILIVKQFIIPFETGIIVIKHWKIHNYIRKDTYNETQYKDEKSMLVINENKTYELIKDESIQTVDVSSTQVRLGKNSIDKSSCSKKNIKNTEKDSCVDDFQKVIDFYYNNIGQITPYGLSILESYKSELSVDVIIYAMEKSVEANKRNIQYIKAILNNWVNKGIKTLIEAEEENRSFKNKETRKETEEEEIKRKTKELEEALNADK